MASKVIMPKLGLTMTEGTLSKWLKKEGDTVKIGDPIFAVETDKLTNEIEAKVDGILRRIVVKEGATAPCLATVAIIGAVDEDVEGIL